MATTLWIYATLLLATVCVGLAHAADYCSTGPGVFDYKWCDYGCCTNGCCEYYLAVWIIVVIVIGSVLLISVVIAVVCCCVKSKGSRGTVVHATGHANPGLTVISAGQQQQAGMMGWQQPAPQYGPPNPGYGYPPGAPQAYGMSAMPPQPPPYSGQPPQPSPFAAAAGTDVKQ